jgi:hypothetical protein
VKKPASIISDVVRAVDSGLINTSQKEGWTRRRGMDLIYPDLSLLAQFSAGSPLRKTYIQHSPDLLQKEFQQLW